MNLKTNIQSKLQNKKHLLIRYLPIITLLAISIISITLGIADPDIIPPFPPKNDGT